MKKIFFYCFKCIFRIQDYLFEKINSVLQKIIPKNSNAYSIFSIINELRCRYLKRTYNKLKPSGIVLSEILGSKIFIDTDDKDIAPKLLIDGFAEEKYETALFKYLVKKNMVVVDVGANIGYYALFGAKLVGKNGIVYAFEPFPNNYKLLCKSVEINNYKNIVSVQKIVSNKNGKTKFWFEKDWRGSPSLSKHCVLSVSRHDSLEKGGFMEITTTSLDSFFEKTIKNTKIDIIKIDTGGAEGLVINGAKKILKNNHHLRIFLEFWPKAMEDLKTSPLKLLQDLRKYGFKIRRINEKKQILEPVIDINKFLKKIESIGAANLLLEK